MSTKGIIISISIGFLLALVLSVLSVALQSDVNDLNESFEPQPINLSCPACPSCKATASCEPRTTLIEACHLPEEYFKKPAAPQGYTGLSNIPSIFMGNEIMTIPVYTKKDLFVGCHYGFIDGNTLKVHRLMAIYDTHLVFRGDNSAGMEWANFEDIQFLVRSVEYR